VAIDEESLTVVARMPGGTYRLEWRTRRRRASCTSRTKPGGETETVIDVRSNQRIATIPLVARSATRSTIPFSRHIYVNVQSRRQLVEIDPATDRVIPGSTCRREGNHGLLIEPDLGWP